MPEDDVLSDRTRARLKAEEDQGVEVHGPVRAEDTSGHPDDRDSDKGDLGWSVALRFETPNGETATVTGDGASPDAAADLALARLERAAGKSKG